MNSVWIIDHSSWQASFITSHSRKSCIRRRSAVRKSLCRYRTASRPRNVEQYTQMFCHYCHSPILCSKYSRIKSLCACVHSRNKTTYCIHKFIIRVAIVRFPCWMPVYGSHRRFRDSVSALSFSVASVMASICCVNCSVPLLSVSFFTLCLCAYDLLSRDLHILRPDSLTPIPTTYLPTYVHVWKVYVSMYAW